MTRSGRGVDPSAGSGYEWEPGAGCYGATFDHAAGPMQPVIGVVRAADTGKPLVGVTIRGYTTHRRGSVQDEDLLNTTTDNDGRFRLLGLPKDRGHETFIWADAGELPYFPAAEAVADVPGLEPVTVDFSLQRGVWVRGRVTDKRTGKPVGAIVHYYCFPDNPALKGVRPERVMEVRAALTPQTREDGSFRVVALPGPGLIGVRSYHDHYTRAGMVIGEEIKKRRKSGNVLFTVPGNCHPSNFHQLVEITPQAGQESITCDLELEPGRTVPGTVLDPNGKQLTGASVLGTSDTPYWRPPLAGADFTVEALHQGQSRQLCFVHKERGLAGSLVIGPEERGPIRVRLQPWSSFTGRVVTSSGEPFV
jgi:hypothetical protein